MNLAKILLFVTLLEGSLATGGEPDTLPPLRNGRAPQNFAEMWAGFDPRAEPLEVETLHQWESDDVMLRIVRFRIGIFKGEKATLAAVYGYPKQLAARGQQVPGLVQIHGGGQYADAKACLSNARRGYATVSIAWAGRISSPPYRVTPKEVKLFWDEKRDDPGYRLTTDWGAVDGYHAPGRNAGNQFPSAMPQRWTLDSIESPRNSGWFLCALAARRALTFLERQPEVDADRMGVYGHSMGGKLTVMAAVDPRVKAAAPSCGGISDRDSRSPLYRATLSDEVSLANVACPILFLSPANDFHGRIGDLPLAVHEISSREYRVTCSPHHSHQDTSEYEVATQLWFDQHLKGAFSFPQTPETDLVLRTQNSIPKIAVKPDQSKPVQKVDVFYTQQGKANERPEDRQNTMNRFWHHAKAIESDGIWTAELPIGSVDKPIWVYANVSYPLEAPVSAVGYYYGSYNADAMNLSSVMQTVSAKQLRAEGVQPTLRPTTLIEDFQGDWEKQWFSYRPSEWARSTHKIGDAKWQAPLGARLAVEVQTAEPNVLVVRIDDYAVALELSGGTQVQKLLLKPSEFRDVNDEPLPSWRGIRRLTFSPSETLRPKRGNQNQPRVVGKNWVGPAPVLHGLQWQVSYNFLDMPRGTNQQAKYDWTTDHMHVGVRWQPFAGLPLANEYDATRPVLANDSSYVQFWASWSAIEPTLAHTDYINNPSASLREIERAVDVCNSRGLKVEFVFFHCPAWASEVGKAGGFKSKDGLFEQYARRIATHFKGRVHAFQLTHEANMQGMMEGADIDFMIEEILLKGAETIQAVYDAEPAVPVLLSTTGMSPCEACPVRQGLDGRGGQAVSHFYDLMIAHPDLMNTVDALNLNISDHSSGFGRIDDVIPSVWDQYDLVRRKLDAAGQRSKSVLSAESWIVWDDAGNAHDINQDGEKNEQDAYLKAITIIGQCLERGLNTINLPWSDNSSSWAMGLMKRRDYNGRIRELNPEIVVAASDGGPEIVTRKVGLHGRDHNFVIVDGGGKVFNVGNYINPPDPNHLHYYIWKWYAQIAGSSDEIIRHAVAGEAGNDIRITGQGFSGGERYRICSFNRTRNRFTVLVYASGANANSSATITIPAVITTGEHYNNDSSKQDFRGEGFAEGERYWARVITKDISMQDGSDIDASFFETPDQTVSGDQLSVSVPRMNRFTAIEFVKRDSQTSTQH